MKIYSTYQTDAKLETEGTWFDLGEGAEVKIARWANPKHQKTIERLRQPHLSKMRGGRSLPDDVGEKLAIETMADAILLDWKGLQDENGEQLPYSKEAAVKLLTELKDFRDEVMRYSQDANNYRQERIEESSKNLEPTLTGKSTTVKEK